MRQRRIGFYGFLHALRVKKNNSGLKWQCMIIAVVCAALFFSPSFVSAHPHQLSLDDAIEWALENNKALGAMKELVAKGGYDRRAVVAKWFPELSFSYTASTFEEPPLLSTLLVSSTAFYSSRLALKQALFSTDLYYAVKVANLDYKGVKIEYAKALNDLLFNVRALYYKVVLDGEIVATEKEHIALLEKMTHETKRKYDVGEGTLFDLNDSKAVVANAMIPYYKAVEQLDNDKDVLAQLLGIGITLFEQTQLSTEISTITPAGLKEKLTRRIESSSEQNDPFPLSTESIWHEAGDSSLFPDFGMLFTSQDYSAWEGVAMATSPSLQKAANALHLSKEQLSMAWAKYFPTVVLEGDYSSSKFGRTLGSDQPFNHSYEWSITGALQWQLFDGMGREQRIGASRRQKAAALRQYENDVDTMKVDVRKQFYAIERSFASLFSTEAAFALAQQAIEQAEQRQQLGVITLLEYRTTIDNLTKARTGYNEAKYSLLLSYYGLIHATGNDIDRVAIPAKNRTTIYR
ncbi:TolC family protein [Simkania negevensis]|uniref:TolC family protein n=1 Tax=Simkania negevensis TaxID=83561 RepID=A0ABS3AU72_9BACT|nr:TolC family protein [Simkania negevensis]